VKRWKLRSSYDENNTSRTALQQLRTANVWLKMCSILAQKATTQVDLGDFRHNRASFDQGEKTENFTPEV